VRHRNAKAPRPQTDSERVDEDLSIAHFYIQSGNLSGAYLRAQDAVKIQPDYALAHFSLGEAAMKLKKNAEAVKEFQTYLKLEPDGKQAKAAEKALDQLN
jgi:Tfp pilus assembly protein PilF